MKYTFVQIIKLGINVIRTKFLFSKARIIRFPFDVRGRRFIDLGRGLTTGVGCRLEAYPADKKSTVLYFGSNVEINDYVHIAARQSITIGNEVLIASRVFISDLNHGNYKGLNQDSPLSTPKSRNLSTLPIQIKDNVWIGEGVCVMAGVTIGFGSVIGALSVVTKDIPDYCIAVGSPARVVKRYDFNKGEWMKVNEKINNKNQ